MSQLYLINFTGQRGVPAPAHNGSALPSPGLPSQPGAFPQGADLKPPQEVVRANQTLHGIFQEDSLPSTVPSAGLLSQRDDSSHLPAVEQMNFPGLHLTTPAAQLPTPSAPQVCSQTASYHEFGEWISQGEIKALHVRDRYNLNLPALYSIFPKGF